MNATKRTAAAAALFASGSLVKSLTSKFRDELWNIRAAKLVSLERWNKPKTAYLVNQFLNITRFPNCLILKMR